MMCTYQLCYSHFWYLPPLSSLTMKAGTVGAGVVESTLHVKVSLSVTAKENRMSAVAIEAVWLSIIFIVAGRFVMSGCLLIRIKKYYC